ncbi:hypothetical protein C8D87_101178 [Lentzea atacamensis]|uniref:Uncharacterized protein n=1 Tax=Lentzea atacamensis TaxID=531938 RepID=A0ABX9EJ26_9PSEU|nr:hypothetical protein C8D87_101178 [Lentzea atacamensis]
MCTDGCPLRCRRPRPIPWFGRVANRAVLTGQATRYMWRHWRAAPVGAHAPAASDTCAAPLVVTGDLLFAFNSAIV